MPFGAGGITDVVARAFADQLGRELKQTVIVDNRPGAGGNIAAEALKNAISWIRDPVTPPRNPFVTRIVLGADQRQIRIE